VRGAATALRLAESALEDSTYKHYGGLFGAFVDYCAEQHLEPLPADPFTIFCYIGHLAEEGKWQESSLQPILSAINRVHRDHGLDPPATHNHFINSARAGMARAQVALGTSDSRIPLPAPAALAVLTSGLPVADGPAPPLVVLREAAAVSLDFLFAGRQDSLVHIRSSDFGVDRPGGFIWLRITEKGKRKNRIRRVIRLPISQSAISGHASALPLVASLLESYLFARQVLVSSFPGVDIPEFFFQLPGEARPTTATMSCWLASALLRCGIKAPPGFAYLGHSIRSGAASAMAAISVPRHLYIWLGGWAPGSSTVDKHYIDPTILPTPAAYAFFGWALSRQFSAEAGVPEAFVPLPDPLDI